MKRILIALGIALLAATSSADTITKNLSKALADSLYCQVAGGPGCTMTGPILLPNGTIAAPSLAFSSQAATGLFWNSSTQMGFVANGTGIAGINGTNQFLLAAATCLGWEPAQLYGAAADTFVCRGGIATLQLGLNSATPVAQTLNLAPSARAGTDTNVQGGNATIQAGNGTGTQGSGTIFIATAANGGGSGTAAATLANRWQWGPAGHFIATTDNANDIGSTANRTRNVYATGFHNDGTSPAALPENVYRVTADFTLAANTSLQTITGLSWVLPANTVASYPFHCEIEYFQATAVVADQFGIQAASLAPTNINAKADVNISASTFTAANLPTLTTTTATAIVTFTPSAITTIWNARIAGLIENPSGVANTINIMAQTSAAADLLTVKRGSFCVVGF